MKELMMKARSGVTLVELLVVILIVTILSVSMLPLLKPFVVESQYAAEAIPVIGNLRTKIGVYQYDKGTLPAVWATDASQYTTPYVETWIPSDNGTTAATEANWGSVDKYVKGIFAFDDAKPPANPTLYERNETNDKVGHVGSLGDINYQELKGKRSRPNDYQYLVMKNGSAEYAYFLGCFGDNNGLPKGTGYAVCEIVMKNHKYVGTWKRYKPVSDEESNEDVQLCFTSKTDHPAGMEDKDTYGCYVPAKSDLDGANDSDGKLDLIGTMVQYGWEF